MHERLVRQMLSWLGPSSGLIHTSFPGMMRSSLRSRATKGSAVSSAEASDQSLPRPLCKEGSARSRRGARKCCKRDLEANFLSTPSALPSSHSRRHPLADLFQFDRSKVVGGSWV